MAEILLNTEACKGIVYIDCMSNSGLYRKETPDGEIIEGTALLVANIISKVMLKYAYPNVKTEDIRGFCLDLCELFGPKYEMRPEEKYVYGVLNRAAGCE